MIGTNVKRLRTESGMTQKQLADKLFVSAQAVSRWENDEVEPSLGTITEMAHIFGVTTDEILGIGHSETQTPPPEPEVVVQREKEYVYKDPPRPVLAVCEICNRPIYEGNEIVRHHFSRNRLTVYCSDCEQKRKEKEAQLKRNFSAKRRKLSFILGPLAAVAVLVIAIVAGGFSSIPYIFLSVIGSIAAFTLVSCCLLSNNFIGEMVATIASWGFVRMPGLIFSLDLDGIIWFLTVKLALFLLGILLGIVFLILGLALGGVCSVFVYPYAIRKNVTRPEEVDDILLS